MDNIQNFYHENEQYGMNLIFCGMEECQKGHTFGPFKRAHYLLHYVVDGFGSYQVNNMSYDIRPGEAFLIYPGDITIYSADREDPWTYIWIAVDGPDVESIMEQCGFSTGNHVYRAKDATKVEELLRSIIDASQRNDEHYMMQLSRVMALLSIMAEESPKKGIIRTDYVEKAIEFIEINYSYGIKITDISRAVMLERSYLYRHFMDETGLSPKEYLTRYRLRKAKEMLKENTNSITEIALSCGFKSSSAFYKHFNQRFGRTPKSYRDNDLEM